ncbi:hypothetical protein BC567DRAFT_236520 [Phyllosticta citribraziliensis]
MSNPVAETAEMPENEVVRERHSEPQATAGDLHTRMERMSAEINDLRKKNDDLTKDYEKLCDMHDGQVDTNAQLVELIIRIATAAGVLHVDSDEDEPNDTLVEDLKATANYTCDAINSMRLELESFDAEMAGPEPQDN